MAIFSVIKPAMAMIGNDVREKLASIAKHLDSTPHLRLLIASVAVILVVSFGIEAAMALAPDSTDLSNLGLDINKLSRLGGAADSIKAKCPECGVVESMRKIEPVGQEFLPDKNGKIHARKKEMSVKTYEVTLRMKDGSIYQFIDANPENWRPGERVMLISGIRK